ncbi:dihydropteroate synthase [Aestuariivirga sp.]|uniref:dihydropteroate synthase n=1 Tax=Aestuariivirga sp. TaxID=2650926 RepID=UPI0035930A2E
MRKTYHRPAGIVHGPDAGQVIKEGRGALLGGLPAMAYTLVEVVKREGAAITRRFEPFRDGLVPAIRWPDDRPLVMGIVNVTPDSFSDGGRNAEAARGIANGLQLAKEGADILDVGGESTRPGSDGVAEDEELRRVIPVIAGLAQAGLRVSVDTRKARVMREALKAGAQIVNDVAALTYEPAAMEAMAEAECPVILMHAQGDPKTMQLSPSYEDVALDVFDWLEARIAACEAAGIARHRIIADPGIGFGKSFRHNLDVLNRFTLYHGLGVPLLMGLSRKGFIGALTGEKVAGNRVHGSVGGAVWSALNGAHILRVHDVKGTVEALAVALAAANPDGSGL